MPWGLRSREQTLLYALAVALLAALAARHLWPGGSGPQPVRKLQAGDQVAYRVNINEDEEAVLALLPGIGPKKAQAIVAYRQAHGPFERVDQLAKVRGVSASMVGRLRDLVTVGSSGASGGTSE